MRVIAGKARRLQLRTLEGAATRPTQDRTKETLFNILQPQVEGAVFLDLFSGSGGIGIEALSRGAKEAWFVEKQKKACDCIRANLAHTNLLADAHVLCEDALSAIGRMEQKQVRCDIIFMDPPYGKGMERDAIYRLGSSPICAEGTLVVAEASLETDFSYAGDAGFRIVKEKCYKTNKHVFLERTGE